MPCFHPRTLWVKKDKIVYEWKTMPDGSVKRGKPVSACQSYAIQVPCGKCLACLAQMQSQWSFRIEQEALYGGHASTLFVTFTYDNVHLPSDYGVHKEEMQKYLHDLRQNIQRRYSDGTTSEIVPKVRYYICAEYGSRRGRPHYHAMLFFSTPIDWSIIQKSWNKGIVDIRPFLPARAGYVAKYSVKQLELDYEGRPRPFHMQSQGLGKCFIEGKTFKDFQYSMYFANQSGHKVKLPRYYLDKLGTIRNQKKFALCVPDTFKTLNFTRHTLDYERTIAKSYIQYNANLRKNLFLENVSEVAYYRKQIERSKNLELNLINLNQKSYYYVKSASESRPCR